MPVSELMVESPSRLARKRARNRDALVAAARKLFVASGVEATTIAAIAEAADLGFGTFYRYFPDKEAILEAVLDAGRIEMDAVLTNPANDEGEPAAALRALTSRFAHTVRRNHDLFLLVWQVGIRGETPGRRLRPDQVPPERSLPNLLAGVIRRIIERGIATGDFAPVNAALASRFIAAAHMHLFSPSATKLAERVLVETLYEFELGALVGNGERVPARRAGRRSP